MNKAFKKHHLAFGAVALAAAVSGLIIAFSRHDQTLDTVAAERADIAHTVSINGSVVADQSVSLTFDLQGKVAAVYADVGSTTHAGDVLAELDTSQVRASIAGAQADVDAAAAQLAKAQNGARPEEKAIYAQKFSDATTVLASAMRDAYLQTEDAIVNKADGVFINGDTPNPTINVRTQSTAEQTSIDQERLALHDTLSNWKASLDIEAGTSSAALAQLSAARTTAARALDSAKAYLADLGGIVGNLTVGNSGIPQATISSYTTLINGANQEVIGASTAEQTTDAAWSSARDALALENAGVQTEDIAAAAATLAKAQAGLQSLQSQLKHSYIVAPFDGVVTAMNVKIGQVFVPGISAGEDVQMISAGGYKIEAYAPETDIGSIAAGQPAAVTFDAFGPGAAFPASVSLVDPAPTAGTGGNSYKVTLRAADDGRLKPGLSANILITTDRKAGAVVVPASSIIKKNGDSFVMAKGPNGYAEEPVTLGITGRVSGQDGDYAEVLSGLSEGDQVARF